MIIESSLIEMTSSRNYREESIKEERSRIWSGSQSIEAPLEEDTSALFPGDSLEISAEALQCQKQDFHFQLSREDKYKLSLLKGLLESFTGKKIKFYLPESIDSNTVKKIKSIQKNPAQPGNTQPAGWGLEYDYHESYFESEQTSFSASAVVKTSDGREINISLALNMSRSFTSYTDLHIRAGDAALTDPLVINFDGPAAALDERDFEFDLDCDGEMDTLSFLKPGSGFLALDSNEDGTINDGSELFGPQNGDGFEELAAYDEDNNGWIDENDSVFNKLRIWTKDNEGNDVLYALGQKGVGAICLANIDTSFALKDSDNDLNGQIRSSGIFLRENGTAGIVQQVDLKI